MRPDAWTPAEDAVIRDHYAKLGCRGVQEMLPHRSLKGVSLRAMRLGMAPPRDWTAEQDALLHEHYFTMGAAYVASRVGRSVIGVRHRAAVLGVRGDRARPGPRKSQPKPRKPREVVCLPARKQPSKPPQLVGEPIITSATKVTICRTETDTPSAPRVIDSAQCRDWARAAT